MNMNLDPKLRSTWNLWWEKGLCTAEEYVAEWSELPPDYDGPMSELNAAAIARARELKG